MHCGFTRMLFLLTAITIQVSAARGGEISTSSLLDDMVNLSTLSEFPSPPYLTKQFSSYDRASTSPQNQGTWFANGDCGVYLRVEDRDGRKEHVMADMQGPGAIVRLWSANPAGTLRIYIDGAKTPAMEFPFADLLSGKHPHLPSPIASLASAGWNLYFPIPYAKSCKVTCDQGRQYYHVNYRTYPVGTAVRSFTLAELGESKNQVTELAKRLADPQSIAKISDDAGVAKVEKMLPPGETIDLAGRTGGSGAIVRIKTRVDLPADKRDAALRALVVRMVFDGQQTVEAPLGDFFGAAPGVNPYASLPLSVEKDGTMCCHWVMPFRESVSIALENLGTTRVPVRSEVVTVSRDWTANSMHFHAGWRIEVGIPSRPTIDWNYLDVKGKGVFAGVAFFIDNPLNAWWGEGDEKIYVDGESFPSHFGTGTEDYFGYAWCSSQTFTHAYHNQPRCDGPGNHGRISVNRFDILDRIPFNKSFKFDMEFWHGVDYKVNGAYPKVNMAVIDYYYALPGAKDTFKPITSEDIVLGEGPVWDPPRVAGAIEGEKMRIVEKTAYAEPQHWEDASDGQLFYWWGGTKPKDELVLSFDVPKAGKYRVFGRFLKAKYYGIVQFAVNGEKAGQPIDFYNDEIVVSPEMPLGTFQLKAGANRLSIVVVGANDKAQKLYAFGLDYLILKPAR